MVCTTDIVLSLMRMKYEDHDLLALEDVIKDPYVQKLVVGGGPIERILQDWMHRLDRAGLLGLINMSHFGRLNEANVCAENLLAWYHGLFL